jgi:kinesin family protein 4/21/27
MGSACSQNYDSDSIGVIPRVLDDLFRRIDDSKETKFTVKVSFVEVRYCLLSCLLLLILKLKVYNEEIKDLLNPRQLEPLNIREENNSIKVVNLTETSVSCALETRELLDRGTSGRVVGGTAMNDQSSRSHAIFTITLEQLIEGFALIIYYFFL